MTTTGALTFATTHRMVDRVHGHAANTRPFAKPPRSAGLAKFATLVFTIADLADAGSTEVMELSDLARRKPYQYIGPFLRHQLSRSAGAADQLGAFADLHFDVVDNRTKRNVDHRQAVAGLNINLVSGDDLITDGDAIGGENILFLAIEITQQGDIRRSVRIIFYRDHLGSDIGLVPFEIDDPIFTLVAASAMTRSYPTVIVAAAGSVQIRNQASFRTIVG